LTGNDEIKSLPTKKVKLEWNLFEFAFIVNFIPSWSLLYFPAFETF
jgi:hypothetical protein